jgi:putative endonuclease
MTDKKNIGIIGESLAEAILINRGYYIIRKNYTCPYGEIDIIASKDKNLSFVEVKTRSTNMYGSPSEAVDRRKQRLIKNAAKYFLSSNKKYYENIDFQVIEVTANHIKNLEF